METSTVLLRVLPLLDIILCFVLFWGTLFCVLFWEMKEDPRGELGGPIQSPIDSKTRPTRKKTFGISIKDINLPTFCCF